MQKLKSKVARLIPTNYLGLIFAIISFCFSMLPSLLPRPSLFQGIISGASLAFGYALGLIISKAIRWINQDPTNKKFKFEPKQDIKNKAWLALKFIGPPTILVYTILGSRWQNEVRVLVGQKEEDPALFIWVLILSLLTFFIFIIFAKAVRRLYRIILAWLDKRLPRRVGVGLSALSLIAIFFWVVSGMFANFFISTSNRIYQGINDSTPEGITQTTSNLRSGGKDSLVKWDDLGFQGKRFIGAGPSTEDLAKFNNNPKEPVRVYAGVKSSETARGRAKLAVDELVRTGGFKREVLVVATPTGTGWLEPQAVDSLEYLYSGDSAIVAQQYSYLPSWISFLVDQENARIAGQELFNAVYSEWVKLPVDERPKLVTYGLSLGSFGGQAAFSGLGDIRRSVDGALYVGTPNDTVLWQDLTKRRDVGSPQWQPVVGGGQEVRFASSNQDILKNQESWQGSRVLYLQHASDPVTWFSFDLIFRQPDRFKEPSGPDVSPSVRWYPFVSFAQAAVDQFFGTTVPNSHGHNYADTMVNGWLSVARPANWDDSKTKDLQDLINSYN